MLVTSVQNNLFLLIAALLCCFPLLELPKKWMAKNPAVNLTLSVTGTVLAAGLLIVSSILMVDATNTPFLHQVLKKGGIMDENNNNSPNPQNDFDLDAALEEKFQQVQQDLTVSGP
ncbi:MAG: hypothetical protein ACLT29_03975 [Ruminococcus callidus]